MINLRFTMSQQHVKTVPGIKQRQDIFSTLRYLPKRPALAQPLFTLLRSRPGFYKPLLTGTVSAVLVICSASAVAQTEEDEEPLRTTDLVTIYEQARQYDADYNSALFDLEAARQNVPLARSAFRPQLSVSGEAGVAGVSGDGEGLYEETSISLALTQSLYDRASSKTLDQAEVTVRQAEAQYAAVAQTLILRVANAYFDVLRADAILEFSVSELEAIRRQLEQAERRFDVGLVPITDVRTAQAQNDLAVAQEIDARNQLATAQEALRVISGLETTALTPLADDLPLTPPMPANIDIWVDQAMQQNLELVIAELSNQSTALQIAIERAARYPTLDIVGAAAHTTTTQEQTFEDNLDAHSLSLQFNLPILTGGNIKASVAQARAQARASEQQLLSQERTTTQQTRDAYRGVEASISLTKALLQALVSTQESADATEAGFRAGTRTSVEVLQALRDTFSARSDYASSRYDYIINNLNLKAAAGTLQEGDLYAINKFLGVAEDESTSQE